MNISVEAKRSIKSSEAEVIGGCELPGVDSRNQTGALCKSSKFV